MNDRELADKVVALGVGQRLPDEKDWWLYWLDSIGAPAKLFVTDWRVAGTLMEKCIGMTLHEELEIDSGYSRGWEVYNCFAFGDGQPYKHTKANGESLPRAIIEACVEALK